MKITVLEDALETQLVIHCADAQDSQVQELLQLINMLGKKIPSHQSGELTLIDPLEVLYGEFVNRTVFLYTGDSVYPVVKSLAELESDCGGFFRCSKSMVVNLHHLKHLKSELSGRILATLSNGERILISRHYASALRSVLAEPTKKRGIQT